MATMKTEDWKARSVGYAGMKAGSSQETSLFNWGKQVLEEMKITHQSAPEVYIAVGKQMLKLEAEATGQQIKQVHCVTKHWDGTTTEGTYLVIGASEEEWYKAASLHFYSQYWMNPDKMIGEWELAE